MSASVSVLKKEKTYLGFLEHQLPSRLLVTVKRRWVQLLSKHAVSGFLHLRFNVIRTITVVVANLEGGLAARGLPSSL